MELKDIINRLSSDTNANQVKWQKSFDQDCCSTISQYEGLDYIICLFNKDTHDEFIVFDRLNEFGYYSEELKKFRPGHSLYCDLKELVNSVEQKVNIIDLVP